MHVLIVGGSGFIGSHLRSYLEGSAQVSITSRNPRRAGDRVVVWDGGLLDDVVISRTDVIVNLAGADIAGKRWTRTRKREIIESRTDPTRRLVRSIAEASRPPRLLVNASGINYYPMGGDAPLNESAPRGKGFLSEVCAAWEREALEARAYGVRVVLTRFGPVLGDGGFLSRLRFPFLMGVGGVFGSGEQYLSWVHVMDLCRIIAFVIDEEKVHGEVNVTAPRPVRMRAFCYAYARALRRPCLLRYPEWLLNLMLGERASTITEGACVLPQKLHSAGFRFSYPNVEDALLDLTRTGRPRRDV